jgi:hypothetical protein
MHTKIELEKMVKARRGCLARRGLFNKGARVAGLGGDLVDVTPKRFTRVLP